MIELTIKNYLESKTEVPVFFERPEDVPETYIIIEKTGSSRVNHIDSSTIAVQCYAESMYEAALLNESIKNCMLNITELWEVSRCDLNSDYNFTDTSTKQYRYQAIYDLVHY